MCYTSYSEKEARNDLKLFKSLVSRLKVVEGPKINRFSSMVPRIDPGVELDDESLFFEFQTFFTLLPRFVIDEMFSSMVSTTSVSDNIQDQTPDSPQVASFFDSKQATAQYDAPESISKQSLPLAQETAAVDDEKDVVLDPEISSSSSTDVDRFTSSIVPVTDDPTMPQFSFRVLVLGTFWCVAFAGTFFLLSYTSLVANMCLSFRTNPFVIDTSVAILLSYPLGKFMARWLPSGMLNPGDFNVKEHVLISIIAGAGGAGIK